MTHDISSPAHVVVPGLQLVRQVAYLMFQSQEFMDSKKTKSTWPVVYSAFVSKDDEDKVFTLKKSNLTKHTAGIHLYEATHTRPPKKLLVTHILARRLPSSGSTASPTMTCQVQT